MSTPPLVLLGNYHVTGVELPIPGPNSPNVASALSLSRFIGPPVFP